MGPSENQSFLDEGAISGQRGWGGVLGGQITGLHDGTIFLGGATHLRGGGGHRKKRHFSGHLQWLKGYSEFTHLTKNQSIGVAWGVLLTLIRIFEYMTNWPFAGP